MRIRCDNQIVFMLVLLCIWTCIGTHAEVIHSEKDGRLIKEIRRVLATKINVQPFKKGAEVYTDRLVTVEKLPDELLDWTLITATSEIRWATREGLCFVLERPAVVYVGLHSRIKNPPEWLTKNFEKTSLKTGVYQAKTRYPHRPEARWDFIMWKRSFHAGRVELGPNKNEALPYITVVEKGNIPKAIEYSGPITGDIIGIVKEGCKAYTDRSYILKDVPSEMEEKTLIGMSQSYALEDGKYSGTHLRVPWIDTAGREILLARDAIVYIAYDASSLSVPNWINQTGFKKTKLTLKAGNIKIYDDRTMTIYSKECKANERVWLGPNQGEGFSGWPLQYLVMLEPNDRKDK